MTEQIYSNQEITDLASVIKVISEPKRLLLLEQIIQGVQCNCDLSDKLDMAPNLISHHLGVLRDAGLLSIARDSNDSRWVYYSINHQAIKELHISLCNFFNPKRIQPRQITCGPEVEAKKPAKVL